MTESYFQSRQREELAACRSRFERAQQKLTTHDEYVRYERKHPGRIQSFMNCAAEQLDKAEQLIDAMKGPEQKARWIYFLTVLQQAIDYMVMAKDDLERSEVISEHSEVVSILNEAISELSEELEDRKQQPLKALEKANETNSAKAKSNYAQWQAWAELIWLENPHWFKNAVAARIKELHDIKAVVETIADKLKKPVSD